jgi:hypothetical protein
MFSSESIAGRLGLYQTKLNVTSQLVAISLQLLATPCTLITITAIARAN